MDDEKAQKWQHDLAILIVAVALIIGFLILRKI